ncbi:hypothetical protein BKA93DRAFT_815041 [Sparassis latifolia]
MAESPPQTTQRSSWEQGTAAQALLGCPQHFNDGQIQEGLLSYNLLQYIYAFAHDALARQAPDGRLAVLLNGDGSTDPGAADPACIGESIHFLMPRIRPQQPSMLEGAEKMLSCIVNECPRVPVERKRGELLLSHRIDVVQIWSDAVYMLPPFLRRAFWGVGNSWLRGGIIRLETLLLENYCILISVLHACRTHRRADGLFHDVLNDPSTFVEMNLVQELSCTLFRLLDLHLYETLPPFMPLRMAAVEKTDEWGFVQNVCGSLRFGKLGTAAGGQFPVKTPSGQIEPRRAREGWYFSIG